ncbi:MAG: hypothetical protein NT099_06775 [Candidatus Saganbacteria bacterium]|nr:hypothetical protein [Candidatus Saganbacteria bacterium]
MHDFLDTNLLVRGGGVRPLALDKAKMQEVQGFLRGLNRLASKFFGVMGVYYFSRGDKEVCQNAAFILSRVLSARFNLPVSRTMPPNQDHIEIAVGIYAPGDLKKAFHQTFLKVYLGEKVFYVDPLFLVLEQARKVILVREYPAETFDQDLAREFLIEPYDVNHRAYAHVDILASQYQDLDDRRDYVERCLSLLHDPKLIEARDGDLIGFSVEEWIRLSQAIRSIEPRAALPDLDTEVRRGVETVGIDHMLLLFPIRREE